MSSAASTPGPESTFRLIYRSRSKIPADQRKAELGRLFTAARSNNKRQHITGALLIQGDWFAQVLEGQETAVGALFADIPLIAHEDGISPAAGRGTTPDQEAILDIMRRATRTDTPAR